MTIGLFHKLSRKYRYAINDCRDRLGLNDRFFRNARGSRIVVYHGICRTDPRRFNSLFVDSGTFERHLRFYSEYFHLASLEDYYTGRLSDQRFNVCITFDDGFANNYHYALPLMVKYAAPMAFFVTAIGEAGYSCLWNDLLSFLQKYGPPELTLPDGSSHALIRHRYIDRKTGEGLRERLQAGDFRKKAALFRSIPIPASMKKHEEYWLQMTDQQLGLLAQQPLATIGCHGYYHNDLARIPLPLAVEELRRNREYLRRIIDKEVNALAFPYGSYTKELLAEAGRMGLPRLLALDLLLQDTENACLKPRMTINPYISLNNQMTAIVHGTYD